MGLDDSATVTIISITFVDERVRRLGTIGTGKKMVVEYEISDVDTTQAAALTAVVASSAADITASLQTNLNADIAANADLAAAVAPVTVDATIPEPTTTEVVTESSDDDSEEESDSAAGSLKESVAVLLGAAAMSIALF